MTGGYILRIISGEYKSKRLISPEGKDVRPTSDKVKESLFNILLSKIPEAYVLDLFAGSGNLGLEAISRGAKGCIFIDKSKDSIKTVYSNIKLLKCEEYCEVYNNDAFSALEILDKRKLKFDIVFCDPPYHKEIIQKVLKSLLKTDIIKENGIIVTEHDIKDLLPQKLEKLIMYRSVKYGNTALSFYRLDT